MVYNLIILVVREGLSITKETNIPIFKKALLQQSTYKVVKSLVDEVLEPHGLNTTQWMILSLVGKKPSKLRVKDIADLLKVEGAFVTNLVHKLDDAGWLKSKTHHSDSRARILLLTAKGRELLRKIEPELEDQLKPLEVGLSAKDLQTYFKVLGAFIKNSENN